MSPIRRFLTAFIFWPLFIFWFIPKEAYRAYRKAGRMNIAMSFPERKKQAKIFFDQEVKVALAARKRTPLSYDYFSEEIAVVKDKNNKEYKAIIDKELGVAPSGETQGRSGE
jgi:hypothetical protein